MVLVIEPFCFAFVLSTHSWDSFTSSWSESYSTITVRVEMRHMHCFPMHGALYQRVSNQRVTMNGIVGTKVNVWMMVMVRV